MMIHFRVALGEQHCDPRFPALKSSSASRIAANSYDFWDDDVTLLMSTRT